MSGMSSIENLWEVRDLPGQLSLELHAGAHPARVLAPGDDTVCIELVHARHVIGTTRCHVRELKR